MASGEGAAPPAFAKVCLPAPVAGLIVAQAREAAPDECCGLLLGDRSRVDRAVPARNIAPEPGRTYTINPDDHFAAIRTARALGLDVIGAYHSHPRSAAVPSKTDREQAFSHFLFLIVGLSGDEPALAAWELVAGNFASVALVRTP